MKTLKLKAVIDNSLHEILDRRRNYRMKQDGSYVSEGDLLVQRMVESWVNNNYPNHMLISEEKAPFEDLWNPAGSYVILDPIDGTENFVSGLKEWGVGLSIYTDGYHEESCILLPEIGDFQITGMKFERYQSRIVGLSSSLSVQDLSDIRWKDGVEYRIVGCAMYNLLMAARGSFKAFENVKGVNCWDIMPGLNLAREAGCETWLDDEPYDGQILFPTKKYRVRIQQKETNNENT